MPAIVKLSLENLSEAIATLSIEEKLQLQQIIDRQIFESEESIYEDDLQTVEELQSVRDECKAGDVVTLDTYLKRRQSSQTVGN